MTGPNPPYRVLIVDDDLGQAEMEGEFLRLSGYRDLDHVAHIRGMWQRLKEKDYDLVLLDYMLPDGTGLDVLEQMQQRGINIPVIMVTGQGNERIAVQAIQRGAADYAMKNPDYMIALPALVHKAVQSHHLKLSIERNQEQIRYQALLLNNVRDAVVVWDLSSRITYWNPAAAALYGWSAEERLNQPVESGYQNAFTPPVGLPKENEPGSPYVVRQYAHKDGRTIWVSSHVTVLRDTEHPERLLGYMDVSHDITRIIQAEDALRESEARYRAIVEDYQTELICRFKPNGALTFANEVFCRYFGKTREQLNGMNFLYFIPEAERPKLIQHLSGFNATHTVATLEHQVQTPDKGLRWLQRTDRVILDLQNRIFEFQSVQRDVTERKIMEAQIQAAQSHLVQAARMATIGEVAAGVAHQIYNPLTTIIADAQLLLRNLSANQAGRESAEAIEQAGWRLQQVVQRLMEFSRPGGEAQTLLSVNHTVQSAVSLVSSSIEAAGCKLELKLDERLPKLRGNPSQLESLWVNLLLLARDAVSVEPARAAAEAAAADTQPIKISELKSGHVSGNHPQNGKQYAIRVTTRPGPHDHVIVEVCDNGVGIPHDQLYAIFEPNFVGPTIGRGTGMELSICREIVRQHSGEITVESHPGHDTIFRVSFPAEV